MCEAQHTTCRFRFPLCVCVTILMLGIVMLGTAVLLVTLACLSTPMNMELVIVGLIVLACALTVLVVALFIKLFVIDKNSEPLNTDGYSPNDAHDETGNCVCPTFLCKCCSQSPSPAESLENILNSRIPEGGHTNDYFIDVSREPRQRPQIWTTLQERHSAVPVRDFYVPRLVPFHSGNHENSCTRNSEMPIVTASQASQGMSVLSSRTADLRRGSVGMSNQIPRSVVLPSTGRRQRSVTNIPAGADRVHLAGESEPAVNRDIAFEPINCRSRQLSDVHDRTVTSQNSVRWSLCGSGSPNSDSRYSIFTLNPSEHSRSQDGENSEVSSSNTNSILDRTRNSFSVSIPNTSGHYNFPESSYLNRTVSFDADSHSPVFTDPMATSTPQDGGNTDRSRTQSGCSLYLPRHIPHQQSNWSVQRRGSGLGQSPTFAALPPQYSDLPPCYSHQWSASLDDDAWLDSANQELPPTYEEAVAMF